MKILKSLLVASASFLLFACNQHHEKLPILGERQTMERMVNGKLEVDTFYQTIPAFSFMNQDSAIINNDSLKNSIYIADFFFTSCPSICPIMSKNMLSVYQKYKGNNEVRFLSHSIDPKHDSIPVLKKYANKLGVTGTQWSFLLGSRDSIYNIARNGYMNYAQENEKIPGGVEHSGYFILVDKDKRIRGAYDGTNKEQVENLKTDIDILLNEYKSAKK
ncbi:electron transporter [Pelobium manganitolerans]|uniref:Electron transporter n=1 Tax=Pelobium manganitolerans TaxID=1842495 RepID=A0A419S3E3_9SPHI|nr:SCO family protein [Pelobium manganitolerans]RKD13819.1 electron transporter [Pelobium manganitolerans]